jgi:hypothetical protein
MNTIHKAELTEASLEDESSFLGLTNDQPAPDKTTSPSKIFQIHTLLMKIQHSQRAQPPRTTNQKSMRVPLKIVKMWLPDLLNVV